MYNDVLIFLVYEVVFECPTLLCLPPKKGKRKNEGRENRVLAGFLNPLEVSSAGRGGGLQKWREVQQQGPAEITLLASLRPGAAISDQSTDPLCLGDGVLFAHPGSCNLCASSSRNRCKPVCHEAGSVGGAAATV